MELFQTDRRGYTEVGCITKVAGLVYLIDYFLGFTMANLSTLLRVR